MSDPQAEYDQVTAALAEADRRLAAALAERAKLKAAVAKNKSKLADIYRERDPLRQRQMELGTRLGGSPPQKIGA